ncbi:MAG: hypothetical protein HXS41_09505 [Theionarchaea archaeon]|nr:hypothetical protein [Theionarchaea archaeon]MBU7021283.1 hypothetical protein [Theionarchaea archaeon]MBU7041451.1 hypothetical protein [Theionarchaea archaeon]
MTTHRVSEHVFAYIGGGNTTALVLPTRIVIIDAGKPLPIMKKIRHEIEGVTKLERHYNHESCRMCFPLCSHVRLTL